MKYLVLYERGMNAYNRTIESEIELTSILEELKGTGVMLVRIETYDNGQIVNSELREL